MASNKLTITVKVDDAKDELLIFELVNRNKEMVFGKPRESWENVPCKRIVVNVGNGFTADLVMAKKAYDMLISQESIKD